MNVINNKFFVGFLIMNVLMCVEATASLQEEKPTSSSPLSAKICNAEEYDTYSKPYESLLKLPTLTYNPFPINDTSSKEALKNSLTVEIGEDILLEVPEDAQFAFSPHFVDCVSLVACENKGNESKKRIYVAHLKRETAIEKLETFITKHNFSPPNTTLSITTSIQSDVLLLTHEKLHQAGFTNISKAFGPFIRIENNTFCIPVFMLVQDLINEGLNNSQYVNKVHNIVERWTSRALIVDLRTGDLFRINEERPNLDSEEVLRLKKTSTGTVKLYG